MKMSKYAIYYMSDMLNHRTCTYDELVSTSDDYIGSDNIEELLCMLIDSLNDDNVNLNQILLLVNNETKTIIRLS